MLASLSVVSIYIHEGQSINSLILKKEKHKVMLCQINVWAIYCCSSTPGSDLFT